MPASWIGELESRRLIEDTIDSVTEVQSTVTKVITSLDKMLGLDNITEQRQGLWRMTWVQRSGWRGGDEKEVKEKRIRILSNSEDDNEESDGVKKKSDEEEVEEGEEEEVEYDSDENHIPKKDTFAGSFTKKRESKLQICYKKL